MADIRLRPRFRRSVGCSPATVLRALQTALQTADAPARGTVFETSAVIRVLPEEEHYWSPHLELSVESDGEGCVVHGLFGPHPTVWSMFVGLYMAIGFVGAMGMAYGGAQWIMGESPWALWSAPVALALSVLVWIAGRTGRALGYDQVRRLYDFVQSRLDSCDSDSEKEVS